MEEIEKRGEKGKEKREEVGESFAGGEKRGTLAYFRQKLTLSSDLLAGNV